MLYGGGGAALPAGGRVILMSVLDVGDKWQRSRWSVIGGSSVQILGGSNTRQSIHRAQALFSSAVIL